MVAKAMALSMVRMCRYLGHQMSMFLQSVAGQKPNRSYELGRRPIAGGVRSVPNVIDWVGDGPAAHSHESCQLLP